MRGDHDAMDDMAEFGAALNTREGYTRHCAGPCDQGRKRCPCPEACEIDDGHVSGAIVWPVIIVILALAAAAAITYLRANP